METWRTFVDLFDNSNNTLAAASIANDWQAATVVKKYDAADVYDLSETNGVYLNLDSGSVKLSFFDDHCNQVKISGNFLTDSHGDAIAAVTGKAEVTLKADSSTSDGLKMSSSDLLEQNIRYVKIEAVGSANNHYELFGSLA